MFQNQILDIMYSELELRLSGSRPSEVGSRPPINMSPIPQPNAPPPGLPRDGVCFQSLSYAHGLPLDDDDHGMCLCQLTACLGCFQAAAKNRKGPISLLPYELASTPVATGWTGGIESSAQAQARRAGFHANRTSKQPLPSNAGFVRHVKSNLVPKPPAMFAHPQMTDVLAVEEHLRWRLKEMGAADPAVESRYGPSTNAPTALEGVDLPDPLDDPSEDGSVKGAPNGLPKGKIVKVSRGKGKVRRVVNGGVPPKKKTTDTGAKEEKPKATCYLPKEWAEEDPSVRSMAIVLTFRHFVKVSQIPLYEVRADSSCYIKLLLPHLHSPTLPTHETCSTCIEYILSLFTVAWQNQAYLGAATKQNCAPGKSAWTNGQKSWEQGRRPLYVVYFTKSIPANRQGNKLVNDSYNVEAVEYYTRAISLDPKKTVYFSNRAVALNSIGEHSRAEADCKYSTLR